MTRQLVQARTQQHAHVKQPQHDRAQVCELCLGRSRGRFVEGA